MGPRPPIRPSAIRFRALLAAADRPRRLYENEALYAAAIEWTCTLLDVVDQEADPDTAARITSAVFSRMAGEEAKLAEARVIEAQRAVHRLSVQALPRTVEELRAVVDPGPAAEGLRRVGKFP